MQKEQLIMELYAKLMRKNIIIYLIVTIVLKSLFSASANAQQNSQEEAPEGCSFEIKDYSTEHHRSYVHRCKFYYLTFEEAYQKCVELTANSQFDFCSTSEWPSAGSEYWRWRTTGFLYPYNIRYGYDDTTSISVVGNIYYLNTTYAPNYCKNGTIELNTGNCIPMPAKSDGCNSEILTDNPCNVATGNKFRSELDFSTNGQSFSRYYNSRVLADTGLGKGWRHTYQSSLSLSPDSLVMISSQGRGEPWTKNGATWVGDADSNVLITETSIGFEVSNRNGSSEFYNLAGILQSTTDSNGLQMLFTYDAEDNLLQVTNHYGQTLTFTYVDEKLETATDALGAVYRYEYDSKNNLVAVVYPDTTPNVNTDNPRKTYHYENTIFPNHLTGITDENGQRYAIFSYDEDGKAIFSELGITTNAVGQEKIELDYQGGN